MPLKPILALVCVLSISVATSASYAGDIISCDSFENCPDGSVPLTNAILELQARMDALEAENTALKELLDANSDADALAHHAKYTNTEAVAAVGPHFSGNHAELTNVLTDQHHTLYTDANAVTAVGNHSPDLTVEVAANTADIAAIGPHSPDYSTLLAGVTRVNDFHTSQDTLRFTNMNVQIVSGSGTTRGETTGTGNLIIGYNERRTGLQDENERSGSHMLVIGFHHNYSAYGGMVVGSTNTNSGNFSSVSGGMRNTTSGESSSVSGGLYNTASASHSSVSGGLYNTASGLRSSVSGGQYNTASADSASVSGGQLKTATVEFCTTAGAIGTDCTP